MTQAHASKAQIRMTDPRPFEEFRLAGSVPERIREIEVVGTAYDSVLASDFTYVSTPITSGAALYAALDEAGATSVEELRRDPAAFSAAVIQPNLRAADATAKAMLRFGGAVIAPAAFEARSLGWSQDDYMGLWLDTIERKATRLALVDGWEYSNGGAEEYLQALLMQTGRRDRSDISIVDARGDTMRHDRAMDLLSTAVDALCARGFEPRTLATVLHRSTAIHAMVEDEGRYGQLADESGRTIFAIGPAYADSSPDAGGLGSSRRAALRLLKPLDRLLPPGERGNRSSLAMAPGLVRADGRDELGASRADVSVAARGEDGHD